MKEKKKLKGIHGWLDWIHGLIILRAIIGFIFSLILFFLRDIMGGFWAFGVSLSLIYIAVLINKRMKLGRSLAIIIFSLESIAWLSPILFILWIYIIEAQVSNLKVFLWLLLSSTGYLLGFLLNFLIVLYFWKSKRVRNTLTKESRIKFNWR